MKPKISILLCTYNSEKLIEKCVDSILKQDYNNFEILFIEGGSQDNTLSILKKYVKKDKRIKILINKNRLPEGKGNGKWLGFRKAKGEIVGIIDHDNILQKKTLFSEVVSLIDKEKGSVGILAGLKHDIKDDPIVRFVSMYGGDPFFAYRSVDFLRNIKEKIKMDKSNYEIINMKSDNVMLTGGNCFFYHKNNVKKVGGYNQDVMLIKRMVDSGKNKLIVIKDSTKHYAERSLSKLILKMMFQNRAYYKKGGKKRFSYLPTTKLEKKEFLKNISFNLLLLPNLIYSLKLYKKFGDIVAFAFIPIVFINTISHSINFIKNKF